MGKFPSPRQKYAYLQGQNTFSYLSSFIDKEFKNFFLEYDNLSQFLPFIDNQNQFFLLRVKFLGQHTTEQSHTAIKVDTSDVSTNEINDTTHCNEFF